MGTSRDDLRHYTVCFTGHRQLRHSDIPVRLDRLLPGLIQQGYRYFGTGGALGFDTEAALAVLRVRATYPHIKLIIVAPFTEQDALWSPAQQRQYREILAQADKVKYTADQYTPDCYHVRNRRLVDGAGLCVAYLYRQSGGAVYTVGYAREQGVPVMNILEVVGL